MPTYEETIALLATIDPARDYVRHLVDGKFVTLHDPLPLRNYMGPSWNSGGFNQPGRDALVVRLRSEGYLLKDIADELARRGYVSPKGGHPYHPTAIGQILKGKAVSPTRSRKITPN